MSRARDIADLPRREAMGRVYGEKSLNENLKPLVRYLRSNVGRPWRKIFSEIRAQVNGGSAVQMHVLQHLRDFVEVSVRDVDGVLYAGGRYGEPSPVLDTRFHDTFYVCPKSGLLKYVPQKPHKRKAMDPRSRKITDTHYLLKRPGGWFEVWLEERPPWNAPKRDFIDVLSRAPINTSKHRQTMRLLGCPWMNSHYAVRTRQLGKRELRAYFE